MNEADLKRAAFMLAEHTPEYLGKPTMPPQSWRLDGDTLIVLLADGRKIRSPMPHVIERSPLLDKLTSAPSAKAEKLHEGYVFPKGYEPPVGTKPLPIHPPAKKKAEKIK